MVKLPKIPKGWENDARRLPLVMITWEDACTHVGWKEWSYLEGAGLSECQTVGYLLPPTKGIIKIAPSIGFHGAFADTWMIPKAWVKSVKRLK